MMLAHPSVQEESARQNTSIGWMQRSSARAKLRVLVKRLLRKCGYLTDK